MVVAFVGGLLVGATCGMILMALCVASGNEDRRRELEELYTK